MSDEIETTVADAVCTMCGCVCDDLSATIQGDRIVEIGRACRLSEEWYLNCNSVEPAAARIRGAASDVESAVDEAARLLRASRLPLVYGLSNSSTDGQRAAVELADRFGGIVDTSASTCHAPSIMALQSVGESTCTLGEVRNRSDLVLFWGSNPAVSHPRHLERYSGSARGEFIPNGRDDRTIFVVDTRRSETAEEADVFLQIEPGADFNVIWALRALIRGTTPTAPSVGGICIDDLRDLAQQMMRCRFGAVFFGLGLARGPMPHLQVEALLSLVTDLNHHTRFIARRMRNYGDVAGADSVLCWQTGYPFSVSLSRGYPRYNPAEFSANELLERGEPDLCLIVGDDGFAKLPPAAWAHLRTIPSIVLLAPDSEPAFTPTVRFTTGIYGIHAAGTAYRMDEVPVPLPHLLPGKYPMDHEILRRIARAASE